MPESYLEEANMFEGLLQVPSLLNDNSNLSPEIVTWLFRIIIYFISLICCSFLYKIFVFCLREKQSIKQKKQTNKQLNKNNAQIRNQ